MIPASECRYVEHHLRVAGVDRLGPHLAELDLQQRRRRGNARGRLRRSLGAALIAVGTRLLPEPSLGPATASFADGLGTGG